MWAIGDVTDRMALTPVALMEAMALTKTLFGGEATAPDHANIATAVFSAPQIGTVGLTEEQAVQRYGDVDVYCSAFRPMRNTISGSGARIFMKLLVDASGSDRVVGVHMGCVGGGLARAEREREAVVVQVAWAREGLAVGSSSGAWEPCA